MTYSECKPFRVFRLKRSIFVFPEHGPPRMLEPGTMLWLDYSRKSSLGGYIGQFCLAYPILGERNGKPVAWAPRIGACQFSSCLHDIELEGVA